MGIWIVSGSASSVAMNILVYICWHTRVRAFLGQIPPAELRLPVDVCVALDNAGVFTKGTARILIPCSADESSYCPPTCPS